LFVCGTTSIEDLSGNKLNSGTSDSPLNFTVQTAAPSLPSTGFRHGEVTQLPKQPAAPSLPSTGFRHGEVTQLPKQPAAKAYTATAMLLEIPKLGVNIPIIGVPQSEDGWDVTWLGNSAGYLSGSAFPTWAGNTVITGHAWDAYNQPGSFAELKSLKYGDQVQIRAWSQIYTYEVRESKLVTKKNVNTTFQSEDYDWITLVTCEFYNPFTGEYLFRRAVRAVLVSVK
ncbi:MAG: sortase, partial [Chloroflexi bacterium]|nr:sortase [Chloroflexota bacterium]